MNEETLFALALEKKAADRAAFLDEACSQNPELRQRVAALLESHEHSHFLETPAVQRPAEFLGEETQPLQLDSDDDGRSLEFLTPSDIPGSMGKLGHYEIQEVIGCGGMGIVLRAFDERLHRVVAIKVMAAQLASSTIARKRFVREAQAAAAVSHDHVVTIHAVDEANGRPYIAMQYVAGQSLQQRLDHSGPLELHEILRIGMQTAAGLVAAHAQGLIHRDIKPANILLENGVERVKITDFGLARAVSDASLTQSGAVAGTPHYMAPEQARGDALDARTDLFSLGSVLYAMCTGRSPFRASGSMAVLKRVCEETPTPIRESNPQIPDWLVAIIDKLHAKNPEERFQSAAEVADLLSRHLAHVQHPSIAPLPAVVTASRAVPGPTRHAGRTWARKQRWAVAAVVLLSLLGGLSLTEATGVTQLASTVIRVLTPLGTLVIEVDDPGVKVTVEGDGGLIITDAGAQEVRLKPGSYRVEATKAGKPVKREVVTITRGGTKVVTVHMEEQALATAAAAQSASPDAIAERGAFILQGGQGVAERNFDTLAEAVQSASDGDTIEVRGNGPFVTQPIHIQGNALTIRAGESFRPVIQLRSNITTNSPLVLEGLSLQRLGEKAPVGWEEALVYNWDSSSLYLANCRIQEHLAMPCVVTNAPSYFARNCEFLCPHQSAIIWGSAPGKQCVIDNCVAMGVGVGFLSFKHAIGPVQHDTSVRLTHSTVMAGSAMTYVLNSELHRELTKEDRVIPVEAVGSIFDVSSMLFLGSEGKTLQPKEVEPLLRLTLAWRGGQNVYAPGASSFDERAPLTLPNGPKDLADWTRFWGTVEAGSIEGRVKYQGGDLRSKLRDAPEKVTPEDFRLRPDSAGYRAGPDGKDLGADVDLVGPGPAYERWKKTPEYQKWRQDTGQLTIEGAQAERANKIDLALRQAKEHAAEGRADQAAQEFSRALSLVADPNTYGTERMRIVGQFVPSQELFERVVELQPNDVNLWSHRAHHLAQVGRWEEAIACYQKRLDLAPDGSGFWQIYGLALLAKNDEAAYRSLCEKILAEFADYSDPAEAANAALAMAVLPDSVKDKQRAFRLAERAAQGDPNNVWWISLSYAAWLYRLDRLEEAIVWLDKGKAGDDQGFSLCFLAMAHHRLGHAEEARRYVDAVRQTKSAWPEAVDWAVRVRVERLIVEMDAVLAAKPDKTQE